MIIRYHELARDEVIETTAYYSRVRTDLGLAFLAELNATIDLISADPLTFEEVRPGIRRCSLRRFPYSVYYRTPDADTVRIIVVRHHSRHAGFGMRRR